MIFGFLNTLLNLLELSPGESLAWPGLALPSFQTLLQACSPVQSRLRYWWEEGICRACSAAVTGISLHRG